MNWLKFLKDCFDAKFEGYDLEGLKLFVRKGKITAEQYKEITDKEY